MRGIRRQDLWAVGAVIGFYALLFALGITCPIKFATGISCPGCGMTRACLALLRLDLHAALHYHPLVWLLPVALAVYLFRAKLPPRVVKYATAAMCALFCMVYLIRMLWGSAPDVVVFAPEKGLLCRLWAALAPGSDGDLLCAMLRER